MVVAFAAVIRPDDRIRIDHKLPPCRAVRERFLQPALLLRSPDTLVRSIWLRIRRPVIPCFRQPDFHFSSPAKTAVHWRLLGWRGNLLAEQALPFGELERQ